MVHARRLACEDSMKVLMQILSRCCVGASTVGCIFTGCLWSGAQAPAADQTKPAAPRATFQFHEPDPIDFNEHAGFTQIFDGKTLTGWDGDPTAWRVENGAIVGESFKDNPRPN